MKSQVLLFLMALLPLAGICQDYPKVKYLIETERFAEARKALSAIIKSNSTDGKAYYYLGETYLNQGKTDSAKYHYLKGIEVAPKLGLNYVGLGKLAHKTNPEETKIQFEKATSTSKSKDTEIPAAIAAFYIKETKETDKALPLLEKALSYDDKNQELYLLMGDAWLLKNDGSKALENYERKALPLNDANPKTYLNIGNVYARTRNYDLAMQYYNQAISKDPQYAPAYKEIAEVYYKAGLYEKAIASYEKYLGIADKDPESDFRYASFVFLNKDYNNTIKLLSGDSDTQKKNPIRNRLLAYSYFETGNLEKAQENLELLFKAAKDDQVLASDFEYMAKIQHKNGNTANAIENYKKAIEKDPSKLDLYIDLGNIYFVNKDFKEASTAYEGKLLKTKGTANDYLNFGKMFYYQQEFKKADSVFTILSDLIPTLPHGHLWKAKASEQLDPEIKAGLAKIPYEKFADIAWKEKEKYKNDLVSAYSYLGTFYTRSKEPDKAASAWKKVKELEPANKNANEALRNYK